MSLMADTRGLRGACGGDQPGKARGRTDLLGPNIQVNAVATSQYDAGASKGWCHLRRAAEDGHRGRDPEHESLSAQQSKAHAAAAKSNGAVSAAKVPSRCYCKAGFSDTHTMHGLGNTAVRTLADAGCTIMTATRHRSLKEVERYTRGAGAEEAGPICRSQAGTELEGNIERQTTP